MKVRAASALLVISAVAVTFAPTVRAQNYTVDNFSEWMYPDESVDPRAPVNGCGSQGEDGVDVPDNWRGVSFTDACNWHDRCYGTKGLSQGYCDRGMLFKAQETCQGDFICRRIAQAYYLGVAAFGGGPYRRGQQLACGRDPGGHGRAHGDPHLVTLDGTSYPFMAAGEFALMLDANGEHLVQARFHPESDSFTVVSGVAVRLGEREVVVQQDPETSAVTVTVDGQVITRAMAAFEEGLVELDTALIGTQQVISIRGWEGLHVEAVVYKRRMDLSVHVPGALLGQVSGLLGDGDGNPANDLVDGAGQVLADTRNDEIYDDAFKEAYRLEPAESMFSPDEGGLDYHSAAMREYPHEYPTIESFDAALRQAAQRTCGATGLDGDLLESCVFDVLVSGDASYADQAARSAARSRDIAHPHGQTSSSSGGASGQGAIFEVRPPLVEAVEQGDIDEVRRLLAQGEDVDVGRESDGLTPLISALIRGLTEITHVLLDAGANPNAFDDRQTPPLQMAILSRSDVELVERLLHAGADPDSGSDQGTGYFSPLSAAASADDLEVVRLLIDHGANIDGPTGRDDHVTPLFTASRSASVEMVEVLLDHGADPSLGPVALGYGPLYAAVLSDRPEVVRMLLDAGANPRTAAPAGLTIRSFTRNEEILRLLG